MFTKRLDSPVLSCSGGHACPAILELETGDIAIIGTDITQAAASKLPADCGCADNERIISIPRKTLISAQASIA